MDETRFDSLTRSIAQRFSRRTTIKSLIAGISAAAVSQVNLEPAEAATCQKLGQSCKKRRGRPRPKCCAGAVCRGNRCQCKPGRTKCGNKCITKNQCCKNKDCANNQRCDNKTNKCGCGKNQQRCQGRCIPKNQCCKNADCPNNQVCNAQNQCVAQACEDNGDCASGSCTCKPGSWPNIDSGTCQAEVYANNFSSNLAGWFDFQDKLASTPPGEWENELFPPDSSIARNGNGTATVQPRNAYDPAFELTAMSTLGGFSNVFPAGGYDVSIDIYLDPTETPASTRFGYTSAINATDCAHRSDFGFEVGTNPAGTALCIGASANISPNLDFNACGMGNRVDLTDDGVAPGWYTFRHEFREVGGNLEVAMSVFPQGGGAAIFEETLPTGTPITIESAGGNRYAWFAINTFADGVLIDNIRRETV